MLTDKRIKESQNIQNEQIKWASNKVKFEWISNKVNLKVVFTPADGFNWVSKQLSSSQPANVIDTVGSMGENMKGKYVEEIKVLYSDTPLREIKRSFDINYSIDNKLIDSLGYPVKLSEEKIEQSNLFNNTEKDKRRTVRLSADKYRDGYLGIILSKFDVNGNCDWVVGDLKLDIKSKDGRLITSKNFKSLQKASYMCANSDSTSEVYIGPDILKVYQIDYMFTTNIETYSGTLTLSGFD